MSQGAGWIQTMSARLDTIKKVDDEIDTESFLLCFEGHASKVYPVMFGGEGMLSGQLSGDLDHNLGKIRKHFEANKEKYSTLEKMVASEVAARGKDQLLKDKDVAVKGMLWLSRTLNFICTFIEKMTQRGEKSPGDVAKETYSVTLEPFHGWIARTTFSSALGWLTDPAKLMELFGFESEEEFKICAADLASKLRPYITRNFALLDKHEVNFTYKVM